MTVSHQRIENPLYPEGSHFRGSEAAARYILTILLNPISSDIIGGIDQYRDYVDQFANDRKLSFAEALSDFFTEVQMRISELEIMMQIQSPSGEKIQVEGYEQAKAALIATISSALNYHELNRQVNKSLQDQRNR